MNKQQQELYDKLLKKVNEFCLGQAAEDVIECIDALVENYENNKPKYLFISNYDSGWNFGVNDNGNCTSDLKSILQLKYHTFLERDFKKCVLEEYGNQYDIIVYSDNGDMEVLK